MMKALDIVGISWLDTLFQCQVQVGYSTFGEVDRVCVSRHQEGQRVCPSYCRITLPNIPGNAYPRMLEKELQLIAKPQFQEEQYRLPL